REPRGPCRRARRATGSRHGRRSSGGERGRGEMRLVAALVLAGLALTGRLHAQAWGSDSALALARRAALRRSGAAADTTLRDYKAQAHGFLFFLGAFGEGLADPPRLVKADQLELEVYWRAPASSKQRVIGWRDQAQLPT